MLESLQPDSGAQLVYGSPLERLDGFPWTISLLLAAAMGSWPVLVLKLALALRSRFR